MNAPSGTMILYLFCTLVSPRIVTSTKQVLCTSSLIKLTAYLSHLFLLQELKTTFCNFTIWNPSSPPPSSERNFPIMMQKPHKAEAERSTSRIHF